MRKLHLGCGQNYIENWINIDSHSPYKIDLCYDLRNPLPYHEESVDFIFNEHFIEHLTLNEGLVFLKECYRVLKINGVLRISTPSLNWLVSMYVANKLDEWKDVGFMPTTKCNLMNEGMRSWEHIYIYDYEQLVSVLENASFKQIYSVPWRKSIYEELNGLECRPYHRELIIEAVK